ncbi:MAG: hypothetical protein JWQ38_88 [Flavipsychrobacter sp.]|nr:hypothetical protein [Flavipsychrobacter sp.]
MELTAVIKAIEYIKAEHTNVNAVSIFSDSQYVIRLPERREKLEGKNFITKKGTDIQNADLVKELYSIAAGISIEFIKVQAHLKKTAAPNYNIEADRLAGKMLNEVVADMGY